MMFLIGQKVLKWSMAISLMFPKSLMSAKYVDGGIKKRDICFLIRKITWESEITNNVPIFPLFPALTHLQTPEQTLNFGQSLGNSIVEMIIEF
ncbi:Protein CBG25786 [Caenorhabditis briggsae]|uniref:Protein CBG25786 n=1 Tax=Caenorhabditis briggsae TaxID=6238 RepID=B6IGK9_CAEBR|nr:Protein CBG25786 [Caenorhabditis briggsae]CAR99039.1 Protein CBG25786 [Caenorhabditis briggsae]